MDYGLVGDMVNSTARIESLTKFYGIPLLVSGAFRVLVPDLGGRLVDRVRVRGKAEPIELWELTESCAGEQVASWRLYGEAWELYEKGAFPAAQEGFAEVARRFRDPAATVLAARSQRLAQNPPEAWDGAFSFS